MFENYGEILGVTDLCNALNLSRLKVYELLESGEINSWRPGTASGDEKRRVWRVTKEDLINYVNRSTGKIIKSKENHDNG